MIITSKHDSIRSASLHIVQARSTDTTTTIRANLTKGCEGALVSDVFNFPSGSYTYHLVGTDIDGVPFKYNTKHMATYRLPDFGELSFEPVGNLATEMDRDKIMKLEFSFTNRGPYNTNFNFLVNAPESLATCIEPSNSLIAAGATIKLQVQVCVIDCTHIEQGTLHTINVTAKISCTGQQIQAPTRLITYRQPDIREFSFEPVGKLAIEMDRDEITKLEFNFTNRGAYNETFNFSVNTPEGLATRIDPSNLLVAAGTTVKLQVYV